MAEVGGASDNLTPQKRPLHRGGKTTTPFAPDEARKRFLQAFERYGNVTRACKFAHISRDTVYRWRAEDPAFQQAWDLAHEDAADVLEAEAWRRAVKGTKKPVYQGGELVGNIQEYSDTLLIFLMKAANPGKYRETIHHQASGEVRVVFTNDWRGVAGASQGE